jgi:hypothetical protein
LDSLTPNSQATPLITTTEASYLTSRVILSPIYKTSLLTIVLAVWNTSTTSSISFVSWNAQLVSIISVKIVQIASAIARSAPMPLVAKYAILTMALTAQIYANCVPSSTLNVSSAIIISTAHNASIAVMLLVPAIYVNPAPHS